MYYTQLVSGPTMQPFVDACTAPHDSVDDFVQTTGFHPYEPLLGIVSVMQPFVCIVTQFLNELVRQHPAGRRDTKTDGFHHVP